MTVQRFPKKQQPPLLLLADKIWSNVPLLWSLTLFIYALIVRHDLKKLDDPNSPLGDFTIFRNAAIALSRGQDIFSNTTNGYIYPPLIAFLYQPFGWLGFHAAGVASLVITAALSLLTVWLGSTELSRRFLGKFTPVIVARLAVLATLLTTEKIRAEFNMWETNALMLFMFTIALAWADRRPALAGAALGFAFNIKYLSLAFIPYLLIRRRWKMVAGFALSAVGFALLPAISIGWSRNLHALAFAYGGLAGLFGIHIQQAAHLFPMTDSRTISITSAIARVTGWPNKWVLVAAGGLAITSVAAAAPIYAKNDLPILQWPPASRQFLFPYRALFGLEWVIVLLLTLIFSPFTNPAHLYIVFLANIAGATFLVSTTFATCAPIVIGIAVMWAANTFPPAGDAYTNGKHFSKWIGLPSWGMLAYCGGLMLAGLRYFHLRACRLDEPLLEL